MKFGAISDLHFALYGQDQIHPESNYPERLHYINKVVRQVADEILSYGLDHIVVAGDTNHTKSIIHSLAMSVLLDYIRDYRNITFTIIDGNHDMSSKSGAGVSALKSLDQESNVNMIHQTTEIENILFVPWDNKIVETVKKGTSEYLVSHFGLNEAQLSSGISVISEIALKDLKQYKACLLGHYHKPQQIGNVYYIGSPIELDWGEKGEEKRYLIVDTDSGSIESIPTTGYIKHIELDIDSENKEEIIKQAKTLKEEGHQVKLNRTESIELSEISSEFRIVDKVEKDVTNRGIDSSMTDLEKMEKFLDIKDIPDTKREKYLNMGKEILNSVRGI